MSHGQADSFSIWSFRSAPKQAFHMGGMDFFLCFFSMILVGILCLIMGFLYHRFTQDTSEGDLIDLRREGRLPPPQIFGTPLSHSKTIRSGFVDS